MGAPALYVIFKPGYRWMVRRINIPACATVLSILAGAAPSGQQHPAQASAFPDTTALLKRVREVQDRFENLRRERLPWGPGSGGRCDERVGRFCFWYGDDDTWKPEPEHPEVIRARAGLIALLDSAQRVLPHDEWVVGQLVRYLIESHRFAEARVAAGRCEAAAWRCRALHGYALHRGGDFAGADTAFAEALLAMSEEEHCAWTDLTLVLHRDLVREYKKLSCVQRQQYNRRLWWLADPLYLTPGNERRTEHYARLVIDRLMLTSAYVRTFKWGDDLRELLVRYGWPVGWERERAPPGSMAARPDIVGHHARNGRSFLPHAAVARRPIEADRKAWDLEPERPRSQYTPEYAADFVSLAPTLTVFPRGEEAIIVAAFDAGSLHSKDTPKNVAWTPPTPDAIEAGITAHDRDGGVMYVGDRLSRDSTVVMTVRVPRQTALLSVEAVNRRDSVAARRRHGFDITARAPAGARVSELLLLAPSDEQVRTLADAIPLARGSDRFAPGEPITVFWELHGPSPAPPRLSLVVTREGKGLFRRIGEFLRVASDDPNTTALAWEEAQPLTPGPVGRTVSVRLPEARNGRYRVLLEARVPGLGTVRAEREIMVEKR